MVTLVSAPHRPTGLVLSHHDPPLCKGPNVPVTWGYWGHPGWAVNPLVSTSEGWSLRDFPELKEYQLKYGALMA